MHVIAQGLLSTVGGATLAAIATLVNWLVLDGPVARIHHTLTDAVHHLSDTHRLNTRAANGENPAVPSSKDPERTTSTTQATAPRPGPPVPTRRTAMMPSALIGENNNGKEETTYARV